MYIYGTEMNTILKRGGRHLERASIGGDTGKDAEMVEIGGGKVRRVRGEVEIKWSR